MVLIKFLHRSGKNAKWNECLCSCTVVFCMILLYTGRVIYIIYNQDSVFYAPEGTSGGILKSHRPSVRQSVLPLQIVSQR